MPTNDFTNQYNYKIDINTNKNLYSSFINNVKEQQISNELEIENFYTIKDAEEYYSGKLKQTDQYSTVYLSPDLNKDGFSDLVLVGSGNGSLKVTLNQKGAFSSAGKLVQEDQKMNESLANSQGIRGLLNMSNGGNEAATGAALQRYAEIGRAHV